MLLFSSGLGVGGLWGQMDTFRSLFLNSICGVAGHVIKMFVFVSGGILSQSWTVAGTSGFNHVTDYCRCCPNNYFTTHRLHGLSGRKPPGRKAFTLCSPACTLGTKKKLPASFETVVCCQGNRRSPKSITSSVSSPSRGGGALRSSHTVRKGRDIGDIPHSQKETWRTSREDYRRRTRESLSVTAVSSQQHLTSVGIFINKR